MAPDLRGTSPVVYEVFPRAFKDTTGAGKGDLRGVLERLGYIRDLGVDALWLAPFYPSPLHDGGYDVSNHRAVDPGLGTLDDFDRIVERANDLGLGVIVDLVLNHTSDEDPRFIASMDGDEDAAAHYVWRDPKPDGTAPNNWMSFFGAPAWRWNHRRRQYYLHQFTHHQPSLDLRNEAVQADVAETVRFWKGRGVSGFRLDVVTAYLFDPAMRDNPPATPDVRAHVEGPDFSPYAFQDHVHDILPGDGAAFTEKIRAAAGPEMWLLGECNSGNKVFALAEAFCAEGRLDAFYTTDLATNPADPETLDGMFAAAPFRRGLMPAWFSSHDHARVASDGPCPPERFARFLATVLCIAPGPVLLYQGEELGLPQPALDKTEVDDPFDLRFWPDGPGRIGARVPLPWQPDAPAFGFTSGTPFLPMRWDPGLAVEVQAADDSSVLAYYRRMIACRREAGFGDVRLTDNRLDDRLLHVGLETAAGRYRALFNYGRSAVGAAAVGEVLLATDRDTCTLPSFGARIERLHNGQDTR